MIRPENLGQPADFTLTAEEAETVIEALHYYESRMKHGSNEAMKFRWIGNPDYKRANFLWSLGRKAWDLRVKIERCSPYPNQFVSNQ